MHRNRFQRFTAADFASAAAFVQLPAAPQPAAQTFGARQGAATMVLVPGVVQASWQAQVYRLAYEKALADTAPPRHYARFFSVWN